LLDDIKTDKNSINIKIFCTVAKCHCDSAKWKQIYQALFRLEVFLLIRDTKEGPNDKANLKQKMTSSRLSTMTTLAAQYSSKIHNFIAS
jgi:hypothetical protein